ncbi:SapC family protein [Sphingomonas oryzagri]|uniref:SapC family protein n=1 Tax=Sphingomonas oryzagri TaxID=3042314 RepID=A0ABT6MZ97_9SPHN|nr:SapC family protein [Sphingomonas oryzagri]MDH7638378.1 SapC family protein [Sphingomonas oryzagri]
MSSHAILTADTHRDLRIRTDRAAELGDDMMMALAVPSEFRKLQLDYPILFRLDLDRDKFTAVALFGFEAGENLFVSNGHWDAGYRPLSVDIQPFLIGGRRDGFEAKQVHIDMASPRIDRDGEGVRVFDQDGRATPYLERVSAQLCELDAGYQDYAGFFEALRRHELLEPLTLDITLDDGSANRLVGFHTIDEDRLRSLDADALGELHLSGYLLPIFMAVASIGNFAKLIARKNWRLRHG